MDRAALGLPGGLCTSPGVHRENSFAVVRLRGACKVPRHFANLLHAGMSGPLWCLCLLPGRANPSLPAGIVLSGAQREVIISLTRARTGMKHDPLPPQHLSPRWFGRRSSGELLRNYRIESALTLDPRSTRFHI